MIRFAKSVILHSTCSVPTKERDRFSLHNIRPGHPLLSESALTTKAKAWLKNLTDALNSPRRPRIFTKENCEAAIKGLFGIAKERERLRVPVINSLKQWVDDNHKNVGPERLLFRHNQSALKKGFIEILKEDTDSRPYHRQCLQAVKLLTLQDPSEYREIQKQITLRRRQAASQLSITVVFMCFLFLRLVVECWSSSSSMLIVAVSDVAMDGRKMTVWMICCGAFPCVNVCYFQLNRLFVISILETLNAYPIPLNITSPAPSHPIPSLIIIVHIIP